MRSPKDELKEMLGMGISRRTMLKRMGYGAAGAALMPTFIESALAQKRPKLGSSLSDFTPQPVWSYTSPYQLYAAPVFSTGTVILSGQDANTYEGVLFSVDSQTKEVRWSYEFDEFLNTPLVVNNVVYAGSGGGNLYAVDASTGNVLSGWPKSYAVASEALTLVGSNIIFPTTDGHIVALDLQGNQVWSFATGVSVDDAPTPVISGSAVMVMMGGTLFAVDLQTGSPLWNYSAGGTVPATGGLSVGGGNVYFSPYFSDKGYYLYAVEIATGQLKWSWPSQVSVSDFSTPTYYNGAVYVGDEGGHFYAVDPDKGALLWQSSVQGQLEDSRIFVEDGVAYFVGSQNGSSTIYALDLASKGQEIASYNPSAYVSIFAIETGVCYYQTDLGAVGVVNLAGLIHQFFCESELMVEDYAPNTATGAAQGNTTSFRSHVQLLDPNKNPRVNKSVKVWASDAVTIISGGQTYSISTTDSAWLETDALGELSIVTVTDGSANGVSTPALYLWGNFMEADEAIVIYPDHDTLTKLSNVQGSDLAGATTYDGTPMLPSTFTQTDDLAKTISNTIGGTAAAMEQTRLKHKRALAKKRRRSKRWTVADASTAYLAYPESTPNMIYQAVAGLADRTYVAGAVVTWGAEFDSNGGVTFTPSTTLTATKKAPKPPKGALPGSFWDRFDDFVKNVVHGAEKVAKIAWNAVEDGIQTIISDIGETYQMIVNTVERAAAVVTGIFKTVVGDIKKAIQWLSYLFDWDDMLATKDQLKSTALQGFTNLKTWVSNQVASDLNTVHQFFQGIETSIQANLNTASSTVASGSLQSQQQNGNNPQAAYGAGGAKSYTKSRWMSEKFKDNASQATVGSSLSLPGDTTDPVIAAMQQLYTDVLSIISNSQELKAIPGDIKNVFSDFSLLVTNPSDFVTHSFSDIIRLISDIAVSLVQLADAVVESLIKTLQAIIDAVIGVFTQSINIPVLSDLYNLITKGSQLTILDLCCLVVAVPTTIVGKVINAASATQGAPGLDTVVLTQNIGYVFAVAFYSVLDPLMDAFDQPLPMKVFYGGLSLLIQGLNFPTDMASNTAGTYIFYVATAIPLMLTAVDIKNSVPGASVAFKTTWEGVAPLINTGYGLLMVATSFTLGITNTKFQGEHYLLMFQNVFSSLPYVFKPLGLGGEQSKIALGVIDGVCDLTSMGLAVAQW